MGHELYIEGQRKRRGEKQMRDMKEKEKSKRREMLVLVVHVIPQP